MANFNVGDKVTLGMTVTSVQGDLVTCEWTNPDQKTQSQQFPAGVLKKQSPKMPPPMTVSKGPRK